LRVTLKTIEFICQWEERFACI